MPIDYQPDGILITLAQGNIDDLGGIKPIERFWESMNNIDDRYWEHGLANKPIHEVLYCYMVYGGYVQYRFNIAVITGRAIKNFRNNTKGGGFRSIKRKAWMTLTAPVIKAPPGIVRKGFQGFRYTPILF